MRTGAAQIFRPVNLLPSAIFWFEFVPSAANSGDLHRGEVDAQARRNMTYQAKGARTNLNWPGDFLFAANNRGGSNRYNA